MATRMQGGIEVNAPFGDFLGNHPETNGKAARTPDVRRVLDRA